MKHFLELFSFWATCVLLRSASTRIRARTSGVEVPVQRLRRLVEILEAQRGSEEHPFWRI